MAQTFGADKKMDGVARFASGNFTSDGTAATISLGFRPRFVMAFNKTTATKMEKIDGMAATNSVKTVTGGTMTLDTGSLIVIEDGDFVIADAALAASDTVAWVAYG